MLKYTRQGLDLSVETQVNRDTKSQTRYPLFINDKARNRHINTKIHVEPFILPEKVCTPAIYYIEYSSKIRSKLSTHDPRNYNCTQRLVNRVSLSYRTQCKTLRWQLRDLSLAETNETATNERERNSSTNLSPDSPNSKPRSLVACSSNLFIFYYTNDTQIDTNSEGRGRYTAKRVARAPHFLESFQQPRRHADAYHGTHQLEKKADYGKTCGRKLHSSRCLDGKTWSIHHAHERCSLSLLVGDVHPTSTEKQIHRYAPQSTENPKQNL